MSNRLNHYVDRSDLHSEKLATIISILQQLEAKQDLMFNNSPPVPGELPVVLENSGTNSTPSSMLVNAFPDATRPRFVQAASKALSKPVFSTQPPKKRGRKPGTNVGPYKKKEPKA